MKIVLDIETNSLISPTKIWVIVTKDLLTGAVYIFRNLLDDIAERNRFHEFISRAKLLVGHNILGYDWPVCVKLLELPRSEERIERFIDTLIVSKLVDYPREGHSVESYGEEFGLEKISWHDYSCYSQELEDYCIRDVEITEKIYRKYSKYINNPDHQKSIRLEHQFQCKVNELGDKGFLLDTNRVKKLLVKVQDVLTLLDGDISNAFPSRLKLIREVTPRETKYGTINRASIPVSLRGDIHDFSADAPFSHCHWVSFNANSHKQLVQTLNEAGWRPTAKTLGHVETERDYNKSRRNKSVDSVDLKNKLDILKHTGWKVNEENLATLPPSAPQPARLLAKRILHEARRRTLTEWINLVQEDGRVHGKFQAIGAWTHRMSHQKPNMANVTNEFDTNGNIKLLGKELRQCWTVPKDRLLVGVDAEGIQLRIFAHLIDDAEFTEALVKGKKSDKTDPHSFNQRIIGNVCKTRQAAKRFIYALLLGAGLGKLADILECSEAQAREALDRILRRYQGWAALKAEQIPKDARRGWFIGLDGRRVRILGDTISQREHLWMSGQLQSGEAIVIKTGAVTSAPRLRELNSFLVNIVHDEYQAEVPNDFNIAKQVAECLCDSIRDAGVELHLRCPLAGSYYNDDHKEFTIGRNWYETH